MPLFKKRSTFRIPVNELFDWHSRPGAFMRLTPPWDAVELEVDEGGIQDGARKVIALKMGPFKLRWVAHHKDYIEGRQFRDEQIKGPFARWEHTHSFAPEGEQQSVLEDHIEYQLPLHPLSQWIAGWNVRAMLERMFMYRHETTQNDLLRHAKYRDRDRLRVAITGASGLLGQALTGFLQTGGHAVVPLVRRKPKAGEDAIYWKPSEGDIDAASLEGFDVVVHLAGENIAGGRWTEARKRQIIDSRTQGTRLVAEALAQCNTPPRAFLSASAIGYYGDNPKDVVVTEKSPAGDNFLAEVCKAWEDAAQPAKDAGIRVVHPRIGVVMTAAGGALAKMLLPFQMGVGGRIGSGKQGMSWISLEDVVGALYHLMYEDDIEGPVNLTSPNPCSNNDFTRTLGAVLRRPTVFPMPAFLVKTLFGQMGKEALLEGAYVHPDKLIESGFDFLYPSLEDAFRYTLGKPKS